MPFNLVCGAHKSKHVLVYTDFVADDVSRYAHVKRDKFTTTYLAADPFPAGGNAWPGLEKQDFIMYQSGPARAAQKICAV